MRSKKGPSVFCRPTGGAAEQDNAEKPEKPKRDKAGALSKKLLAEFKEAVVPELRESIRKEFA